LKQGGRILLIRRRSEESGAGMGGMPRIEPVPEGIGIAGLTATFVVRRRKRGTGQPSTKLRRSVRDSGEHTM